MARSYRSNIQSQNTTYNLGDTAIFNIPTRNNLVLVPSESYLNFNINFANAGATASPLRWDSCGAHGCIQRVRIFSGSNLISDIDNYNLLVKMLYDVQVNTPATYGKYNITSGTRGDFAINLNTATNSYTAAPNPATATVADIANTANLAVTNFVSSARFSATQANTGDRIDPSNSAGLTTGTITASYSLNLVCLLGSLCSQQYIPLFAMKSSVLRMEVTFVSSPFQALACGSNVSFTITAMEYVGNYIELGDPAMGLISASLQGQPLQYVIPEYRNYQFSSTLTNGVPQQIAMPIPAKFSSLRSLFCMVRDKGTGTASYFPFSCVTAGIVNYQFRVGSNLFPLKAVATSSEMFWELGKAIGSISDLNYCPSISKDSYTMSSSVANNDGLNQVSTVNSSSFYIGLDLENYSNAAKDQIFAGYNSNNDDIYFMPVFNPPGTSGTTALRFDAFALFDAVLVCENDTAYIKF